MRISNRDARHDNLHVLLKGRAIEAIPIPGLQKTPKGLAPEALARRRKAPEPAPQAPRRGAAEGRRRPASMLRRKTFFRIFP